MKKYLLSAVLALTLTASAQPVEVSSISVVTNTVFVTNTPPAIPFFSGPIADALKFGSGSSSNWAFAGYGITSSDHKKFGAGVAALYKLNDYVVPTLRLDYYDGRVFMPSASLSLQAPIVLFGLLTAIPFAFTGLATPLSGKGNANNTAVGIAGMGMAIQIAKHFDVVWDVEKWSGFEKEQIRAGVLYKIAW